MKIAMGNHQNTDSSHPNNVKTRINAIFEAVTANALRRAKENPQEAGH